MDRGQKALTVFSWGIFVLTLLVAVASLVWQLEFLGFTFIGLIICLVILRWVMHWLDGPLGSIEVHDDNIAIIKTRNCTIPFNITDVKCIKMAKTKKAACLVEIHQWDRDQTENRIDTAEVGVALAKNIQRFATGRGISLTFHPYPDEEC